jgi:hypothetical protein
MVRDLHCGEDRVDVLQQPRPPSLREVEVRPGIEDDLAAVGIRGPAD